MARHLKLCASFPVRLVALLLGCCLGAASPAAGQAPEELVDWRAEAVDPGEAAVALSRFYATMYNSGQIVTREVTVEKGDTPTDVMRRAGSWPAYLGPSNRILDAVVCDLNPTSCRREKTPASGEALTDISRNVGAFEPTDGDWTGLRPGMMLRIPNYKVERSYETISTSAGYLNKRYGSQARTERTGALAALYCNNQPTACPDRPVLTWDEDSQPPILQFDPHLFESESQAVTLPEDVIDTFVDRNARAALAAVPYLSLRQILALPPAASPAQIGLDEIQQSLPANVLVAPQLRSESAEAFQDMNRDFLDQMALLPLAPDADEEPSGRIVTIYHFDKQAQAQHCVFQNLIGVELFEWRGGENGTPAGPVEVEPADAAIDCSVVEGVATESKDHGTHTLGMLVGQLEVFAKALPPDLTYFNVVHVPLNASEFEHGDAPEAANRIGPVLSDLGVGVNTPDADVVSMSLSWPAAGMDRLDDIVRMKEDLTTFVVAAPRQEQQNECARGPAGIKWQDGSFAENVISVVGLNLDGAKIVVLEEAGTGSSCHEIGAFGALFGPIGETNGFGLMKGASQATPLVAATVAELIRRLPYDRLEPRRIGVHLVATAQFDPDLLDQAKATLLDSSGTLRTGADLIVTRTGCKVFGNYSRIKDLDNNTTDFFFAIDNKRQHVSSKASLLSFRNLDADRVLVVWLEGEDVRVEIGLWQSGMDKRIVQFSPDSAVRPDGSTCDDVDLSSHHFPASIVDQLVVRKIGG